MPSFILIRPTVWPQYTNVTDRTDRQRTDSIGRTVLQTVAQKTRPPNLCQRGLVSGNSVCPSVRASVCHTRALADPNNLPAIFFIPKERAILLVKCDFGGHNHKLRLSSSLIGGEMSCRRNVHVVGEMSGRRTVS